jgi:hypothetical protein
MIFKNATKKSHDSALAVNDMRGLLDQLIQKARGENVARAVRIKHAERRQFCEAALRASLACDSVTVAEPIHVVPTPAWLWLPGPALSMQLLGLSANRGLDG